jgi:hypothetical protein
MLLTVVNGTTSNFTGLILVYFVRRAFHRHRWNAIICLFTGVGCVLCIRVSGWTEFCSLLAIVNVQMFILSSLFSVAV